MDVVSELSIQKISEVKDDELIVGKVFHSWTIVEDVRTTGTFQ